MKSRGCKSQKGRHETRTRAAVGRALIIEVFLLDILGGFIMARTPGGLLPWALAMSCFAGLCGVVRDSRGECHRCGEAIATGFGWYAYKAKRRVLFALCRSAFRFAGASDATIRSIRVLSVLVSVQEEMHGTFLCPLPGI